MSTLLAKRTNAPTATDDETYAALVADPEVSQFQHTGYNQSNQYSYIDSIQKNNRSDSVSQPTLTAPASSNAATGADVLVENTNKDWINKRWRPVMAWHYVIACTADFVIFPILWSILQSMQGGQVTTQWQPLTLQGAGLYHIAMGAVLGIAVYGRTKEKLEGKT